MVPETASQMRALRESSSKPIVAVANVQAASAAYWLASQANEVVVTPSGEVGSIGVYSLHRDLSEKFAKQGVKHTLISAGKYKAEGNPYEPLADEAVEHEREVVHDYMSMFVKDVAQGRGVDESVVRGEEYGEGRSLTAQRAVKAGLADRVATLSETVSRLSSSRARVRRAEEEAPKVVSLEERQRMLEVLVALNERRPA